MRDHCIDLIGADRPEPPAHSIENRLTGRRIHLAVNIENTGVHGGSYRHIVIERRDTLDDVGSNVGGGEGAEIHLERDQLKLWVPDADFAECITHEGHHSRGVEFQIAGNSVCRTGMIGSGSQIQ